MLGKLVRYQVEWYVVESKTVKNCFGCEPRDVKYYHKLHPDHSKKLSEMEDGKLKEKNVEFVVDEEYVKLKNVDIVVDEIISDQKIKSQDLIEWEEIEEEYSNDNYPPFGGPFTDALGPFEWLKLYFKPPIRKI